MFKSLSDTPKPSDLDVLRTALQTALDTAAEEERPGLRRALGLVEDFVPGVGPDGVARTRTLLAAAGIDPRTAEVKAVREVRRAHPGLSLQEAVDLVRLLVAQAG
ncbi:hypothetical protein [Kitasatospora sp. NPDC089509]|uniref:hypothetical protein n=1 Tax=Kitasatospora sp. NPDC089509 TaxID=3364079 RepID=UPI003821C7A1